MTPVRGVLRRVDAWAALLLGVLVTLGVIILFALPGPWHHVAPGATPQPLLAPPPPPSDVAVIVTQGQRHRCAGVVWLHIDYALPRFSAVVVPARLTCRLPRAGFQPLDQVADEAGPAQAAASLGEALGVAMGAWITVDPGDARDALPGFLRLAAKPTHPRPLSFADVWTTRLSAAQLDRQVGLLRRVGAGWSGVQLNLVGFVNYVLGSPDVATSMKLQAVSAIAGALDTATPVDFVSGALPVVLLQRGDYRLCLPRPQALSALRAAFAVDASTPVYRPAVVRRPAGRTVLVLTTPLGARQERDYERALDRTLADYGATGVRAVLRSCTTPAEVTTALTPRVGGRPLGAVLAFGRTEAGTAPQPTVELLLRTALADVRASSLPAVVSGVPAGGAAATELERTIDALAATAGFPVSPVAPVAAATATASSTATPASPTSGPWAEATTGPAEEAAGTASPSGAATAAPALVTPIASWARANAATFVRVVEPRFFAPTLPATRLGISYYERLLTKVGVVADAGAEPALLSRLTAMGYAAVAADDRGLPRLAVPVVYYPPGERIVALALAGDLGLAPTQAAESGSAPAGLTLVMPLS